MKIGLLIVDMQEVFLQGQKEKLNVESACEHINHVADFIVDYINNDHLGMISVQVCPQSQYIVFTTGSLPSRI